MLVAGGAANRSVITGIFAIDLSDNSSWNGWGLGSANNNPYTRNSIGIYFNIS